MTELEILRRRRKLVVLSADVQRATVIHRVNNFGSPIEMMFGLAVNVSRAIAMRRMVFAAVALAVRLFRRRTQT